MVAATPDPRFSQIICEVVVRSCITVEPLLTSLQDGVLLKEFPYWRNYPQKDSME